MDVEQKRELAKTLRGVSYDARTDRFTAEIYEGGQRRWLGSYHTAQEASDAYAQADAAREPRERSSSAFAQVYAQFRQDHGGDRTEPPEGAELVYGGQTFVLVGVTWRKVRGRKFAYMVWDSDCQTCGEAYRTLTPAPVSVAKGITRNCPQHVRGAKGGGKPVPSLSDHIAGKVSALAMLHDRLGLAEAARWVVEQGGWDGRVPPEGAVAELIRAMVGDGTISAVIDNHGDLIFE